MSDLLRCPKRQPKDIFKFLEMALFDHSVRFIQDEEMNLPDLPAQFIILSERQSEVQKY
jgi:hypothetical protein